MQDELRRYEEAINPTNLYRISAELIQAICLPKDKKKMKIRIQIGNNKVESSPIDNTSTGFFVWKESKIITADYQNNFVAANCMEAVFVYLVDSDG